MTRQEILRARTELANSYRTNLEKALASVGNVSNFTKHMWNHARQHHFETRGEIAQWVRENMTVDIAWKMSPISHMRTAATKHCRLCMKERVTLFFEFGKTPKPNSPNLMNSRDMNCLVHATVGRGFYGYSIGRADRATIGR